MTSQQQCHLCQKFAKAMQPEGGYRIPKFYSNDGVRIVTLGTWEELQRNQACSTCSRIVDLFRAEFQECTSHSPKDDYYFCSMDYSDTLDSYHHLGLYTKSSDSNGFVLKFRVMPLSNHWDRSAVLLNIQWLDLDRVLDWIKTCNTMHGACNCRLLSANASFSRQSLYLVDVSKQCLVKGNAQEKYTALSYAWDELISQFKTTKQNLVFLQKVGSLSTTAIQDKLPATVKRAMSITKLLGIQYLWVDCLCIVQDDPAHLDLQINNMAKIYSNSYLTLCAADGVKDESCLLGVPGSSFPRAAYQDILTFISASTESKWVTRKPSTDALWSRRGWTFQEAVLSSRLLIFKDDGLLWRCQEGRAEEQNAEMSPQRNNFVSGIFTSADTVWPCVKKWDNMLSTYLKRDLRYEEDILRAFAGIHEALAGSMYGGFHYGLPEAFFDAALLWVPDEFLRRRKGAQGESLIHMLPSWSWAGWKGTISSQINAFGLDHVRSNELVDFMPRDSGIFPCVEWFKVDRYGNKTSKISNNYADQRYDASYGTVALTPGWSFHAEVDENGDRTYYYEYDKAPKEYTFWYPIPVNRGLPPTNGRSWTTLLYCKTFRGFLELGSALPRDKEEFDIEKSPIYSLRTEDGTWAGILYSHYDPTREGTSSRSCELILISGGFVEEDGEGFEWFPEMEYAERTRSISQYLFHHVLWIEWKDGIAYRKGLGRVVSSVWDDLPKEELEIFLG